MKMIQYNLLIKGINFIINNTKLPKDLYIILLVVLMTFALIKKEASQILDDLFIHKVIHEEVIVFE